MGEKPEKNLEQLEIKHMRLHAALARLVQAKGARELNVAWEDFVGPYQHCCNLMNRYANAIPELWKQGSALRKERERDKILGYVYACRNEIEHADNEHRDESLLVSRHPGRATVADMVSFGAGNNVIFSGCSVNGAPLNGSVFWPDESVEPELYGNLPLAIDRGGFLLRPVKHKSGRVVEVPRADPQKRLVSNPANDAVEFARYCTNWVDRSLKSLGIIFDHTRPEV